MTEEDSELFSDSRRSFMKKGALATTALALGASATSGTASAQEDGHVYVYGDDYRPGVDFEVVTDMTYQRTEAVLDATGAEEELFDDPGDWDVYLINYDMGVDTPTWGLIFTEEVDLSAGDSETMSEEAEFRDPALDLIQTTLGEVDDDDDDDDDDEDEDDDVMNNDDNDEDEDDENNDDVNAATTRWA